MFKRGLQIFKKNKPYKERLMHLKLPPLKFRRLRDHMIEVFEIFYDIYDRRVAPQLPSCTRTNTRGNNYKLLHHTFHYDLHKHFYSTHC